MMKTIWKSCSPRPRFISTGSAFNMTSNSESEPLHIAIGKADSMPMTAIFLGAQPRGNRKVSISAVLEDARVHVN